VAADESHDILEPDIPIEVEETEEIREVNLEIREARGGRVVTVLEVLSPGNKTPWSKAHQSYLEKQTDILQSDANLVEIDLLRSGARTIAASDSCLDRVRPFDYLVSVLRSSRRSVLELYPRTVRQPLPRVRVPLRGDPDVVLDLQAVFQRCYEGAPYGQLIDYQLPPAVPLLPEDADWADNLLREKGVRGLKAN
jgi:hypothetical protein